MLAETLAAALVGLLALFVVLRPLIWPTPAVEPVFEPVEQEETPRGVALLALKEIEFDRETGKLSDEDYRFLKEKYTAQAIEALRAEEAGKAPDDVEALNLEGLYSVTRIVRQLVEELGGLPERLAFDPRQFEPRAIDEPVADEVEQPPLKIGVVPGPEDGRPGVPVDALVEASPGALAGIRVGDRIVRVGAHSVDNVYDYVRALREVPPDASWRMVVERDGSRVTLTVEPAQVPQ